MADKPDYDAVVVGAGHNGLVATGLLAQAGLRVLLVEGRRQVGGMTGTEDLEDGFRVSSCAHIVHALHPAVVKELNLYKHGLEFSNRRMATVLLDEEGKHIQLSNDPWRTKSSIAPHSQTDAETYGHLVKQAAALAGVLSPFILEQPPAPRELDGFWKRLQAGLKKAGRPGADLLTYVFSDIAQMTDGVMESPLLRAGMAFDAVLGTDLSPRDPGTAFLWLLRQAGETSGVRGALGHPKGGLGALSDALWTAARLAGAELRLDSPVERIETENARAAHVRLATGERISARWVLSSVDPVTTYLGLIGPRALAPETAARMRRFGRRGSVARITASLDGLPEFPGLDQDAIAGRLVMVGDLDQIVTSHRDWKYGEQGAFPLMEVSIPSLHDASLAPGGKHVLSINLQYAPYRAASEDEREALGALAVRRLSEYSRALPSLVRSISVKTPHDLERLYGVSGGQWHHGAATPDRLFALRPDMDNALGLPPIAGLVLCGAGSSPFGGVSGAPGYRAARFVLAQEGVK